MLSSIPDWAFTAAAIALAALATALYTWNRLRPRTRPTPRCSKCNYNLDGHHLADAPHFPITCPECGKTFTTAAQLFAHPRRWMTPLVVMLLVSAYGVSRAPHIRDEGWWASLPLSGRIVTLRLIGPKGASQSLLDSVSPTYRHPVRRWVARDYTAWQARQLLEADRRWKSMPTSWLDGVPIPAKMVTERWQPKLLSASLIDKRSDDARVTRNYDASYIQYWFSDAETLPVVRKQDVLETTDLCVALTLSETLPVTITVPIVDSLDRVKTPLNRALSHLALDEMALQGFTLYGRYFGVASTRTSQAAPTETVAGLRLQILDGETPIAEARWSQRTDRVLSSLSTIIPLGQPGKNTAREENFLFATDQRLIEWLADPDDRFTVRITTDPEMVLCDFEATHYLDVDITLPGSALKRKPPTTVTPPAAAQP